MLCEIENRGSSGAENKKDYRKGYFEVDPVALHIHERVSAEAIIRAAQREDIQRDLFAYPEQRYQDAIQFYQHDVDWANRMILGDSLNVMMSLLKRENVGGKVQMIYFDPPYGIKFSSNWQPELKNESSLGNSDKDVIREAEQIKAYRDTWTLGIHSYLHYLKSRLMIMRELLNIGGSIFLQISDENVHRVRMLLDEVFGPENQVATIGYKKASPDTATIKKGFNYILWYARSKKDLKVNKLYRPRKLGDGTTEDPKKLALWLQDVNGQERSLTTDEKRGDVDTPENASIFRADKVRDTGKLKERDYVINFRGEDLGPGNSHSWRGTKEEMNRLISANRILRTDETLAYKLFLEDSGGIELSSFWDDTAGKIPDMIYVVQTNTKIIERCMLMTTEPGDLILDPTCGAGTSAFSAEKWGRRWITIDTSRIAISLARQRMMTANYPWYKLRKITDKDIARKQKGVWLRLDGKNEPMTFVYETIPHIKLKSIARNENLDPIFARHEILLKSILTNINTIIKSFSSGTSSQGSSKGKSPIGSIDGRPVNFPRKELKEWEVPFEVNPDWPVSLKEAIKSFREAWTAKMEEVNVCIRRNAEQEELIDKPEVENKILRVCGPFTVEGVSPEEISLGEDGAIDPSLNDWSVHEDAGNNTVAYFDSMLGHLKADGVTFIGNKNKKFKEITPLYRDQGLGLLHAEGFWEDSKEDRPTVAITFGPQYGSVTASMVEEWVREAKGYEELVIAGFSFDGEATAIIAGGNTRLKIHQAHIRPDLNAGMQGLLKDTAGSQLFTVFGQPEIKVSEKGGQYIVNLKGVDIYDPLTGTVRSENGSKVAAWFLDGDFDGRCFCITQAFFPDQDAWEKIAKALKSSADLEAFEKFKGTISLPFAAGKYKRIAVKVIDPRGNEVMAISKLEA